MESYKEAVIFLFYRDNKILIEHRPSPYGIETFIPNGSIEEEDHEKGIDYRIAALHREIREEFLGKVNAKTFVKLSEFHVPEMKVLFYTYLITEWDGQIPEYTVEDGRKFADLEWINLDQYREYLKFDSAIHACKKLKEYLGDED